MAKLNVNIKQNALKGYNALFDDDGDEITYIDISNAQAFANHPYHVQDDDAMDALVDSIKTNGILLPVIVRKITTSGTTGVNYEIISGHRRIHASKRAGLSEVPAIIRNDLDDNQATILMVESNYHRETLLPSEKAWAYRLRYDAIKATRTKGRPQKNHGDTNEKLRSDEEMSQETGDSKNQIHRYIRLTYLHPTLLGYVDDSKLVLNAGVQISYLADFDQTTLCDAISAVGTFPNLKQADKLRDCAEQGPLTVSKVGAILRGTECESKVKVKKKVEFRHKELEQYFPAGTTVEQMEEEIISWLRSRNYQRQKEL